MDITTLTDRKQMLRRALYRGRELVLPDPRYHGAVVLMMTALLYMDSSHRDLTVEALGIRERRAKARIIAREDGVVAGLAEVIFLCEDADVKATAIKNDGDNIFSGDTLLQLEGGEAQLLVLERVGLNILQRMSGIATATRDLQQRAQACSANTHIVGTRKTPWGLLDKRAIHLGGGGTHRLDLGDAILIKNNHLALIDKNETVAAPLAIAKVWNKRALAAFIEVEVRSLEAARAAAEKFAELQTAANAPYRCLLLLDNMSPAEINAVLKELRSLNLWDAVLIEASGGITEANFELYATCGVDAISMGSLTHSARALDICQRME